ncbi:MAG: TonB-dependent receptor [Acidobacteria bacterium]|nr:TonB-dependent receptor [Acidobacteriota bacterium]
MSRWCLVIFSFLALSAVVLAAKPSSWDDSGSISGRIVDSRGGVIQQVTVTLRDQETGIEESVNTDSLGTFQFEALHPALYYLSTEKENFQSTVREIFLSPDENHEMDLTLQIDSQLIIHERVMVIGDASQVGEIPGSAHYIAQETLEKHKLAFDDIHQILRQVPGVNIQEEDGYGLRPNIGMRGTGTERSSKITLMEDGVLIAPAPYAAPAAYYFPITGRMEAIEVRKGSSQIKYGPRTNGGALNLISTSIPQDFNISGNLALGIDNTRKLHLNLGDSYKHFAWMAETYQIVTDGFKQLDGGGNTGFNVDDYLAKFRFQSEGSAAIYQELEIKLGKTQQLSDETYLGLTDVDFAENPFRRYRGSQQDVFRSDHEQYQARYFIVPTRNVDVTTVIYRNNFQRNWYKLQSVSGTSISKIFNNPESYSAQLAIVQGADSDPDALAVRANNREYYSQGIQTVLGLELDRGETQNSFELGFRYHKDQEDRFQHEDGFQMVNGSMVLTSQGTLASQANRIGDATAWALFIQDKIERGRWTLSPGFRYENIDLLRTDFSKSDPERLTPTRSRKSGVEIFIPGLGANFEVTPTFGLFGGLHKGFAPPGPGSNKDTEAEESLNYEFGFRLESQPVSLQVTGFFNDYANLLGADSLAAGGTGEGDLFNGGQVQVVGLEASGSSHLGERLGSSFRIPARFAYTFTDGKFKNSFESQFEPWGTVVAGDELPYLPRHQFNVSLGLEKTRWRLSGEANYVSRMRTKAGQGPIPGLEATDAYLVFNLSGEYDLRAEEKGTSLFLSVRNLTDQAYIVARRPAGARPGLPRTVMGGIRFRLGR